MQSSTDQDRPYFAPAPVRKADEESLFCFLNPERECDSTCMAFNINVPNQPEYRGSWAQCKLLISAHQIAKHMTIVAQQAKNHVDDSRRKAGAP